VRRPRSQNEEKTNPELFLDVDDGGPEHATNKAIRHTHRGANFVDCSLLCGALIGGRMKRADGSDPMRTLQEVARERFPQLLGVVEEVADLRVYELGDEVCSALCEKHPGLRVELEAFFSACRERCFADKKRARLVEGVVSGAGAGLLESAPPRMSLDGEKLDATMSRTSLASVLKFVNREKSVNALLLHAAGQYAEYQKGYRVGSRIAVCSGGPGVGKVSE
jgi:hypothetical protein